MAGRKKKITDFTIEAMKRAYLRGEGSYQELAEGFDVGLRSIERIASEQNWRALKEAQGHTAAVAAKAADDGRSA